MRVTRSVELNMAHRLHLADGPERRLHGHRYIVEVSVVGDRKTAGAQTGMVVDFAAVDTILERFVGRFDRHTLLYSEDPLFLTLQDNGFELGADSNTGILGMAFVPTAENLAQYFANMLVEQELGVSEVTVWETARSQASAGPQPKCSDCQTRGSHDVGCPRRP